MKRLIIVFTLMAFTFTGMAYARTYKIGVLPWVGFSPNNVADAKGFWKAQGLDVQVVNFSNCQDMQNGLMYKRIDIAHQMIGSWIGLHMEDVPITILAELDWSHGGDKIIVKKDRDLRNLKGQTVGVYLDSPAVHFFLYQYLVANKIGLSDIRLIELDVEGLADNFIAGRFPAIVSFDPQALRAEREGNGQLAATSALYPGCIPEGYAARTDVLKDIPAADLVKIFRGWIEAVRWIREDANWEEYRQILNNRTFADEKPYSDKDLKQMFDAVSIHDMAMLNKRNKNEGGLFTFLGQLRGMLKENKMLRKGFDPQEIFDNRAIMEGIQEYQ